MESKIPIKKEVDAKKMRIFNTSESHTCIIFFSNNIFI